MKMYRGIDYSNIYQYQYSCTTVKNHSMDSSLEKYIEMKLVDCILDDRITEIQIIPSYNRTKGISKKEKIDKLFNYKRPTFVVNNNVLIVSCYPGVDYVYHYASLIKTYLNIFNQSKKISVFFPSEADIQKEIENSNLKELPECKTVILGYVTALEYLSIDTNWHGTGDFLWKKINNDKLLVGCKHSYWGDISGYIVSNLAKKGVEQIIYVGKLGTLNEKNIPNETIATGSQSIFFDGSIIEWKNIFQNENSIFIKKGVHYTLPSIIQETKEWVKGNKHYIDFVDPEIGHMARAALENNIGFSYMHIITDNLAKKYNEDLSNERKEEIIAKRKKLIRIIGDCIIKI